MFKAHGTKVIGMITTVASIFAAADPTQVAALLGKSGPYAVTAALGLLTVLRGFSNSKAQ
jgi:hypothetical protein